MSVYLLHFDRPIGDTSSRYGYAQHYTGSTPDLARRLAEHLTSSNVKIMDAVRRAGIGWTLARTWEGGRLRERQLKVQGGASRHCPVCKGQDPRLEDEGGPAAQPRAAGWTKPADPEPEPLENFIVARLEPAEATALVAVLDDGQRAAWQQATTPGPGARARFETACEVARISGQEARAAQRMTEAREIAAAEEAAYQEAAQKTPQPERQEEAEMPAQDTWPPWPAADTGSGDRSRARAYEEELTTEGRGAFADRGYLVSPDADRALIHNREQVTTDLAQHLSPDAAAQVWQAAYSGMPGLAEYRVPDREMDLEAG